MSNGNYEVLIYLDRLNGKYYASPGELDVSGRTLDGSAIRWRNDTSEDVRLHLPGNLVQGNPIVEIEAKQISGPVNLQSNAPKGIYHYSGRGEDSNRRVLGNSDPRIRT